MSLRYIFGRASTGKTTLCINEITNTDNMAKRVFYIVPEQFTLESEKNLLGKKESLININVLGFKHFAYYLVSKSGTSGRKILDDTGRAMLIKKIVLELKNKLEFYKNSVDKQGFIDNLDNTITEFMQYGISDISISELILKLNEGNLKEKLKDIRLIFNKYKNYLEESYIASDGLLDILCELIPQSTGENCEVWIDGFKSFTPQENKVIEQLLKYCGRVNITLPLNSAAIEYNSISILDENYEVKKTVTAITKLAKENRINVEEVRLLTQTYKVSNNEIEHLKENYFKYKYVPYSSEVNNIQIYKANNMYDEIEYICGKIKSLVQYKNYRYKDIALIVGDSSYNVPLSIAFKKYDIPNFIDGRKNISNHSAVVFITSALDTVAYGFDNGSVFKFLKTGYTDIDFDDIFELENYTIANGIDTYKWNREWKYGFKDEFNKGKPDKEKIENIKNRLFEILSPLKDNFSAGKKYSVRDITEKLFAVACNAELTFKLEKSIDKAKLRGDTQCALIDEGVWNIIVNTGDKIVDILGDEKVTLKEYSKILKTGLNTATIGIAPITQDYIIAGNMEITRFPDIKAMFVIGANEGNIPVRLDEKGIFTDDEKEKLRENDAELAPNIVQKMNNGRLSIYINITKPSDYLIISYPTGSISGAALPKSSVVSRIEAIFPLLEEKTADVTGFDVDTVLTGRESAFSKMIRAISENNNSDFISELYNYFAGNEQYDKKLRSIKHGIFSQIPKNYIGSDLIETLWHGFYEWSSVSKLESFASCPFMFFMKYVLGIYDRDIFTFEDREIGNLSHKIMEKFSKHITQNHIDWSIADKEYTDKFVDEHIDEFIKNVNRDKFETDRNSAIFNEIINTAKLSLWANVEQIKASRFKPENFEISFGRESSQLPAVEIEIEDNRILRLNGVIDRVDKMIADDGKAYVKIVDYKSSSKELDINKIYNGIQIQLVLYMNAVTKGKNTLPGGMFYFNAGDIKAIKPDENIFPDNDGILNRMALMGMYDESIENDLDTVKIYPKGDKDKTPVLRDISLKNSTILDSRELHNLVEYSNEIVKRTGSEMAKGNISVSPYEYEGKKPCNYCSYNVICNIRDCVDERTRVIKENDADIWNEINKEE